LSRRVPRHRFEQHLEFPYSNCRAMADRSQGSSDRKGNAA
jgi:hypothetical protein